MTEPSTYALLAAAAYADIRLDPRNQAPIPAGWTELTQYSMSSSGNNGSIFESGFSARVYRGPGGEIVISYAGTEFAPTAGALGDFLNGNIPLAQGNQSHQAYEAAFLYQRVKNEQGPNITFTGHSLGGGLASVMAVWFNQPAYVFAPAPFQASADASQASSLPDSLAIGNALQYARYNLGLTGPIDPAFANFNPAIDFAARESNVQAWAVKGEVLEATLGMFKWIEANSTSLLANSATQLGILSKHSIDLHASALLSGTFDEWAAKIPTALPRIFDKTLYGNEPLGSSPDFLIKLNRNEVGVQGAAANGMLTHFAADLEKLGGNITGLKEAAQDAILAQAIEWYYWQSTNYSGKEFLTQTGSLLQYTTAKGDNLAGALNKASAYVDKWLTPLLNEEEEFGGNIDFQQWNVSAGTGAVTGTARDTSKTQLFIGHSSTDNFTGGAQADLILAGKGSDVLNGGEGKDSLYGGEGDDTLDGGAGNDQLKGGQGNDKYTFSGAYGSDVIKDTDGQGSVVINGATMTGGKREDGKSYYYDKPSNTYYYWSGTTLSIRRPGSQGQVTVQDWSNGQLGIRLVEDIPKPRPVVDPIVLDLDSDGIETVGLTGKIHFDHANDGFAELTGWVGADDGMLVRDIDGDGKITSGKELFGSETLLLNGSKAANGFAALAELDLDGDKTVTGDEAIGLKIWRDLNQNGLTDAGELQSLADAGVRSIKTTYTTSSITDSNGNQHRQVGSYVAVDGSTRSAVDVWLVGDPSDSIAIDDGTVISPSTAALPNIEGYGKLPSLHQSMAKDPALQALVTQFAQAGASDRATLMRDILWRWTGADTKTANSRGTYIADARWLYMVEAFTGSPFTQVGGINSGTANPGPVGAADINAISKHLYELLYSRLGAQTYLKSAQDAVTVNWDEATSNFIADVSQATGNLRAGIVANRTEGLAVFSDFVRSLRTFGQLTPAVTSTLLASLSDLGPEISQAIQIPVLTGFGLDVSTNVGQTFLGTALADTLVGTGGNDVLSGDAGNDTLIGGLGNDVLDGGAGNDKLFGNEGADTYLFGRNSGQDTIDNFDQNPLGTNADRILFNTGVTPQDVALARSGDDLILTINGTNDSLTVLNFYAFAERNFFFNGSSQIESVQFVDQFSNQTIWTAEDIRGRTHTVTQGDDRLTGLEASDVVNMLGGNDTVYGLGGNDSLTGGAGADQLFGGIGLDTLDGGTGDDFLDGGAGDDTYWFGLGDGNDTLREGAVGDSGGTDTLRIRSGVLPGEIKIRRDRTDIVLSLPGHIENQVYVSDSIRLQNVLDNDGNNTFSIERVEFDNGEVWTLQDLKNRLISGSDGNDLLEGYATADGLNGGGGDDTLIGNDGDDVLLGEAGSDKLYGGAGSDVLDGGTGNDTLSGGSGDNFYLLNPGTGHDVVERTYEDLWAAKDTVLVPFQVGVENVVVTRDGADVIFQIKGTQDSIRFKGVMVNDGVFSNYSFQYGVAGGSAIDLNALKHALLHGGASDDILTGYATDDSMTGGAGNDVIDGAGGQDTLVGGTGDDVFYVDRYSDQVIELADEGFDVVHSSSDYALSDNIETLVLDASAGDANGAGNDGSNRLVGNQYSNVLNGMGGIDTLEGGDGDDTYIIDTLTDEIIEVEGGGSDTVMTELSYTLTDANLENIELFGSTNASATGNAGNNLLRGNAGNNRLDGRAGVDQMAGGLGNDTYVADQQGDRIIEAFNEGIDTIERSFDTLYILESNVENLTLLGTVYRGNGNELNNLIIGNDAANNLLGLEGNDTLIGGGGNDALFGSTGADSLIGGTGDDYYEIDDVGDRITELENEGDDFVRSTVSWTLGANLERLAVDGAENLTLTGNGLNNGLWGNDGANVITGGKGNDYLEGGAGNDTYVFNKGDGQDSIDTFDLTTATDTLRMSAQDSDVLAFRSGTALFLKVKNSSDQIGFINYYAASTSSGGQSYDHKIDRIEFSNGASWNQAMIQTMVDRSTNNRAPTVSGSVPALSAWQGTSFSYVVPIGTVTDPDAWDSIAYSVTMPNGSALPSWLTFDAASRTLSGVTPVAASLATTQFILWGTDNYGSAAGTYVNLTVRASNTVSGGTANADTLSGGASSDVINGLGGNDKLYGYGGNDRLDGGTGIDTMYGGIGDDVYVVDNSSDQVVENIAEGDADLVLSTVTYTLSANVERITLTGSASINATGNSSRNTLTGNDAANILDGGGDADTMIGGLGADTYVVDHTGDVIQETGSDIDTVQSSISYTLGDGLERLTLTGTANLSGTGNDQDNELIGNDGDNTLDAGSAGQDTLKGGLGNDTYVLTHNAVIVELFNQGVDTVNVNFDTGPAGYTLGSDIENATLLMNTDGLLYGNSSKNVLIGGLGNDTLDGGDGDDSMTGGDGDDTYYVTYSYDDDEDLFHIDKVIELDSATSGVDTVITSSTGYALAKNVENLTLLAGGYGAGNALGNLIVGSAAVDYLYGRGGDDTIFGGQGNDTLYGDEGDDVLDGGEGDDGLYGGLGTDTMTGGDGNDTYYVSNYWDDEGVLHRDKVIEGNSVTSGIDTVLTFDSDYTLANNVENLTLMAGALARGNSLGNRITGSDAADFLEGRGGDDTIVSGAGNDIIWGGDGNDYIDTGAGNDYLDGGIGNDTLIDASTTSNETYTWGRGQGIDTLTDSGGTDQLNVQSGVTADQLWLRQVGNSLELSVIGTSDKFIINDWYTSAANQVENVVLSDGKTLTASKVDNLVNAMAGFTPLAAGQTTLPSNYQTSLNPVIAANWA